MPFPPAQPPSVEAQHTKVKRRFQPADPRSLESHVRQLLCNKIMGNLAGVWLLIPEHLRLGSWELLLGWSGQPTCQVQPRIALQLVHEAALCVTSQREKRTLCQRGFEVANGLPFVASDPAVHRLLDDHGVQEAIALQSTLGKLRRAQGHFVGQVIAIDPHRIRSYSKRQMIMRKEKPQARALKQLQTFFALDADSQQPICFTAGASCRTVTEATWQLLEMTADILRPREGERPLVLADTEHYTLKLLHKVRTQSPFDLLVPMPWRQERAAQIRAIDPQEFIPLWIGYALCDRPYLPPKAPGPPYCQIIERKGERPDHYTLNAYLCTARHAAAQEVIRQYPKRWHCEEFFNANQALGWNRAGTQNMNIRYGQMTLALIAQAVTDMLRRRLGHPMAGWDAAHLANDFFRALEGDVRIRNDTIVVTYYNAPNPERLARHFTGLPDKLLQEGVDPKIPWLFGYKLDFRFK